MKAIDEKMAAAFIAVKDWHESNTRVNVLRNSHGAPVEIRVRLWGNLICRQIIGQKPIFSTCGYSTSTTRNRLQALGANCRISGGVMVDTLTGAPFFSGSLL